MTIGLHLRDRLNEGTRLSDSFARPSEELTRFVCLCQRELDRGVLLSRSENGPLIRSRLGTDPQSPKTGEGEKEANPTLLRVLWPNARDSRSGVTLADLRGVDPSLLESLRR